LFFSQTLGFSGRNAAAIRFTSTGWFRTAGDANHSYSRPRCVLSARYGSGTPSVAATLFSMSGDMQVFRPVETMDKNALGEQLVGDGCSGVAVFVFFLLSFGWIIFIDNGDDVCYNQDYNFVETP
jgi:hypothetical protein